MKAIINAINPFKPSPNKKTPAEFIADATVGNEVVQIDMLSVRKLLNVKRLSPEYISIIKKNEFKDELSVTFNEQKGMYTLDKDNLVFVDYLINKRQS